MRKLAIVFCFSLVSCGDKKDKESEQKEVAAAATGDVEFSGYVQKAFTIKVNSKEFSDSEDFYTRFIDELVKPAYPDVTDVKLEGKYGLDEFGSQSKMYMSSVAGEGHLYEGKTNDQSKFTIKVQSKALDETYKARIVIRIGLEVSTVGGDGRLHFCYLLHGNKEGISVSDSSKPIIFEEFATQLTKYKCEDVVEETLDIPGLEGEPVVEREVKPGTKEVKQASITSTVKFAAKLSAGLSGSNTMTAATMDSVSREIVVMKAAVERDSKWCFPVLRISGKSPAAETCVGEWTTKPSSIESVAVSGDSLLGTTSSSTVTFKSDGTQWDEVAGKPHHLVVMAAGTAKYTNGAELCDASGCTQAPARCDLGFPQTVSWLSHSYLMANGVNSQGATYCGAGQVHVISTDLSLEKSYSVAVLEVSPAEFLSSKIVTNGEDVYLLTLIADELIARKLEFPAE